MRDNKQSSLTTVVMATRSSQFVLTPSVLKDSSMTPQLYIQPEHV